MEKIIERIKELESKKKISNADSSEVSELIYKVYCSNKDCEILINYLYNFHYKICGSFARKHYFQISNEEKSKVIQFFLKSKRFSDNKSGAAILRGFAILTEIIGKDSTENNAIKLINRLAKLAGKDSVFNPKSCEVFLYFLNEKNGEFFNLDLSSLSDDDKIGLFRYTSATITDISTIAYREKFQVWANKYSFTMSKQVVVVNVKSEEVSSTLEKEGKIVEMHNGIVNATNTTKTDVIDGTRELIKTLQFANQEAQKLFDNIFSKNNTIQNIQEKLNAKEKDIALLRLEIENKNTNLMSLNGEINKVKTELSNKEIKIDDLTERLKISFNADDISKKQELLTLKNDIATAVKLQYEDFNEHKNESCTEDNYQALKVNLNQVFRTLKKYGIEL